MYYLVRVHLRWWRPFGEQVQVYRVGSILKGEKKKWRSVELKKTKVVSKARDCTDGNAASTSLVEVGEDLFEQFAKPVACGCV